MEKFIVVKDTIKKVPRFNLKGRVVEFKLKPVPAGRDPVGWVKEGIDQVIQNAIDGLSAQDQVGFSFCSKDFKRGDGWLRFQEANKVTTDDIWNIIYSIYQSNSLGLNTETFCLGVTSVGMPIGKGKNRRYNTFEEECAKHRGVVTIKNNDNLCLPRALVVAIAHVTKDPCYTKIRRNIGQIQTKRALKLIEDAGVTIPEHGAGIAELEILQRYLKNYKIVAYRYGTKGRDVIFCGSTEGPSLNMLHHNGHFNTIISLTAAFCCSYYCEMCRVPYNNKDRHRCGDTCAGCYQSPSCSKNYPRVKCDSCQRSFRGQECYENHKRSGSLRGNTVCGEIRKCNECLKTLKRNREHTCGEIFCKTCSIHAPQGHLCYIKVDMGRPKITDILFVFYDLETHQETVLENGSYLHKPSLCVFKQCCDVCLDTSATVCGKCGVRLQILKTDPIARFVEFILNQRKLFKQVTVIAHNGQSFDHQFILSYILTKTDIKPELIMRGTKILLMTIGNVKFIDSLNYFPMALAKLPKAFGLGDNFKKGYFPHLFNTLDNQNYVGPLPAAGYYDPDNMKENERATFLKWHEQHETDEFDLQRDIVSYCISDVEILTQACLKFRRQLMIVGNVCPFTEACTIASACNKVFRRNFLKPNTIGIIPKNGYRGRDRHSRVATQWLIWLEKQSGKSIIHAAKEREVVKNGVKVDGFCPNTGEIFEFHGCYFHGCLICFKYNRDDPLQDNPAETLNYRYESTVAKSERLREFGYTVIEMWECQFIQQLATNKEMQTYTTNHPLLRNIPLNPRDAFYGGRTGNTRSYYQAKTGERIMYLDVCSLYPSVCRSEAYPLGHPQVYIGSDCYNIEQKDGLIKCKILPPIDLYHPVLPTKMNDKLMFVLCRTCGETMSTAGCAHAVEERALTGTWVIDEVKKAVEKGYTMLKIYEIWHYPEMAQFDKLNNSGGLFTEMMNQFIKVKQQATGFPGDCTTDVEKNRYIEKFFAMEGIRLDSVEIMENPGLRSLAKLMLNSFWGKFGQRENQVRTKIVNNPDEFFGMLANPALIVNATLPINENTLVVNYEFIDEAVEPLPFANVCIASYVTSQARIKLYSYLEQLGERVLYYDTDSVVYISRPGEFDIPTGQFIGDMTDELEAFGVGSYIKEFVSGGPKNYAYKVWSTKENCDQIVCKVKGISLTYNASQLINFETIKEMVLKGSEPIPILSKHIRRTEDHQVVTRDDVKLYRINSTKRVFLSDGSSVPYGYKKMKIV